MMRSITLTLLPALMLTAAAHAQVSAVMSAKTAFGGGDGWLSPADGYTFITSGATERGLSYSTTSNHLYLVSRASGAQVRILDSATGSDLGSLDTTGVSGGTFALDMISVGGDGTIYAGNLAAPVSATSPFKIYKWNSESDVPTVAFSSSLTNTERVGDTLDAFGSGANTILVAGYGNTTNGYLLIDPTVGLASPVPVTGTTINGEFRSGITFAGSANKVWGDPGSPGVRKSTWSGSIGGAVSATNDGILTLTDVVERPLDVALINGVWVLATIEASTSSQTVNNEVRLYDVTDAINNNTTNKTLLATLSLTNTFSTSGGNGDITWGSISGGNATLYAMDTGNGIQAFDVTVTNIPEPGTAGLVALGALGLVCRRRR